MKLWADMRPWLLPALTNADEAELIQALATGNAQLWAGDRSAMVTQVHEDRSCHVWLAGGDLKEILTLRPGIEAWARGIGCHEATIDGRKGWQRALGPHGYQQVGHELRKAL